MGFFKVKSVLVLGLSLVLLSLSLFQSCKTTVEMTVKFKGEARDLLKTARPDLTYDSIFPEYSYENLQMLGEVKRSGVHGQRNYGMVLRTMRFQNITLKVEKKYGLPKNLLLAMIMQESGGADLLPNSGDDGGLGLIHMQPSIAREFGLKVYQNCDKLVSKTHGKALRKLITDHKFNKIELIQYDDRFHPILNIDAAGRMIAYYAGGKQYKETPLQTAVYRYAGAANYHVYYDNLLIYLERLNDKKLLKDVEREFNAVNPNLIINGQHGNYKSYIKSHQRQNINYGLRTYK